MREREQSLAMPWTTKLLGQAPSGERRGVINGIALAQSVIRIALGSERQGAVNDNGLDHLAIRAGPYL